LIIDFTSQGFNNFFEVFKFPLALFATLIAILTLRVTFIRAAQTQVQLNIMAEQINLVEKQLLLSQRPELYILPSDVSISTHETNVKLKFQVDGQSQYRIKLLNVGNGIARNIKLIINYNYESAINMIKNNLRDRFDLTFSKVDEYNIKISSSKLDYNNLRTLHDLKSEYSFDYLLPVRHKDLYIEIILPEIYLELLFWFNELTSKDDDFPPLHYHFTYLDLGDTSINREFEIFLEKGIFGHGIDASGFRAKTSHYNLIAKAKK